jgi:hypothetical protein
MILAQALAANLSLGEISCQTRYFPEASSISFLRSSVYGLGVVWTSLVYRCWRWGLSDSPLFDARRRLEPDDSYYRHYEPETRQGDAVRTAPEPQASNP